MAQKACLNSKMIVLDVASGAGHVAMKISLSVRGVYAIDVTPKMLELLKENLKSKNIENVKTKIMQADNLNFSDNFFDVVTCRFATHHFVEIKKFLSEVKRVLKPHGKFILSDIVAPSSSHTMADFINEINILRDHTHVRSLSISEWEKVFSEYNMIVRDKYENQLEHDFDSWFKRAKTSIHDQENILEKFRNSPKAQTQFQTDTQMKFFTEDSVIFTIETR